MELKILRDEELIDLYHNGNIEVENILMNRYKQLVKVKAKSYYMAGADRDDVIQEGMIGVLKAIRDYDKSKGTTFYTFVELCIQRQIISAVRGSVRKKHIPLNESLSLSYPMDGESDENGTLEDTLSDGAGNDPATIMIMNENLNLIERGINLLLSDLERKAWEMYMQGCSYKEIAEKMDRTGKTIDNAICRAKKKLSEMIER